MRVWQLKRYGIRREEVRSGAVSECLWIWGKGPQYYWRKLAALPGLKVALAQTPDLQGYTWCVRVEAADAEAESQVEGLMQILCRTLCIKTPLDECFALAWHSQPGGSGKPALTTLGQWIHLAKSYDLDPGSVGDPSLAGVIAEQMVEFVRRHPLYCRSDGIVAALPSNPEKAFDLPRTMAEILSRDTGIPFCREALVKTRRTAQMKYCPTLEDKLDNIRGSVQADTKWVKVNVSF